MLSRRMLLCCPRSTSAATFSTASPEPLYLGLDVSTQGCKATAINGRFGIVASHAINYAKDLPHYGLKNGVHASAGNAVTQPTLMFLEALDLLLTQMKAKGFPFAQVAAVSGSGQQHGSAYWRTGARALLQKLAPGAPLKAQLADAFRLPNSPIWMDSSTGAQCAALEKALGGPEKVAAISGSRAYERFTGNQIAKLVTQDAAAYEGTERISLVRAGARAARCCHPPTQLPLTPTPPPHPHAHALSPDLLPHALPAHWRLRAH